MDNISAQLELEKSAFARLMPAPMLDPIEKGGAQPRETPAIIPNSEKLSKPPSQPMMEARPPLASAAKAKPLKAISSIRAGGVITETYSNGCIHGFSYAEQYPQLPSLFNSNDESEAQVRVLGSAVFVARKTTMKKAAMLIGRSTELSGHFAQIVGGFAKESGSCYIVSMLERAAVADANLVKKVRTLGNPRLRYLNLKSMGPQEKQAASRAIVRRLAALHKRGMLLGRFRTSHVAFYNGFEEAKFTDPRYICEAGDSAVPEAMLSMAVLKLSGLVDEGQMLHLARYYLLEGGLSPEAQKYFSDRSNVGRETIKKYSALFAQSYGNYQPGSSANDGQIAALFVSKSVGRFLLLAQIFRMS